MVRAHLGAQGRAARRERDHQLVSRAHQARPLRRLAREQRRLGARRATATGARRSPSGDATTASTTRASVRSPSSRSSRAATSAPWICTGPSSTTSRSRVRRARSGTAYRIEPVLDAWFDSGSMPAAQFHYPFENADAFAERFPADFICEAIDQTRGWFYSLLAVNTLAFGKTPYRNVVCLAHIVDKDGVKMSKSRGNVIDPVPVLAERGADALRWYMLSSGSPWTPKRVYVEGIDEATRQFLLTLWNTYSFFVTYANIDGWHRRRSRRRRSTCSTGGSRRASTAPCAPPPTRSTTSTRSPERPGPGRARRRPLELVRAPVAAALLEVVGSGRARDAAPGAAHAGAAPRAVLSVRRRRAVPQPRRPRRPRST